MEPKDYQKSVLNDLDHYLAALDRTKGIHAAWRDYWDGKGIAVNAPDGRGAPGYYDDLAGVPNVCIKVPTGGGKTFLAACSVRKLFNRLPVGKTRFVMWLVPSDAILTQTVANLSNPEHPYRKRLDRDFGGRVNVYTKEQLLNGQNFKPADVAENLSICVFCYASIRVSALKKDDKKIYQENGNLMAFADVFKDRDLLLADTPETALMNVIRQMNPAVVVDESHNAKSDLSIAMLRNLNPSFVLAMTATPTERSNIISYVNARELKRENMVKLPVIVYNRPDRACVVHDAVRLREMLEAKAKAERRAGGDYIRPIVLFQAQPKTSEDSDTFEKIKARLVAAGIPERQVAIKTAQKDELKGVDLLAESCSIRYIVTVNALKEGWDCPFAYVLASLANKTSRTDVEQIVGRILRQPFARSHADRLLNMSFVLSCSANFQDTLRSVEEGLNGAGFSARDYRVATEPESSAEPALPASGQPSLPGLDGSVATEGREPAEDSGDDDFADVAAAASPAADAAAEGGSASATDATDAGLAQFAAAAAARGADYEEEAAKTAQNGVLEPEMPNMKTYPMNKEFATKFEGLSVPKFVVRDDAGLFGESDNNCIVDLDEESLADGFSLAAKDATVDFNTTLDGIARVDISSSGDVRPKSTYLSANELDFISKQLAETTDERKLSKMAGMVADLLDSRINFCKKNDLAAYVERAFTALPDTTREALSSEMLGSFSECVIKKIRALLHDHRKAEFRRRLDGNEIQCLPTYSLPSTISPVPAVTRFEKTLYEAEWGVLNVPETETIQKIISKDNVLWWHRIRENTGFFINGWRKHFPDFMVMTKKGTLVLVEVKGPQLDGTDSQEKCELGKTWADQAGSAYKYFMVFLKDGDGVPGSIKIDAFLNTLERL